MIGKQQRKILKRLKSCELKSVYITVHYQCIYVYVIKIDCIKYTY